MAGIKRRVAVLTAWSTLLFCATPILATGVRADEPPAGISDSIAASGSATATSGTCGAWICLVGGSGTVSGSSATCAYTSQGAPPETPEAGLCSLSLNGAYTNLVCGTMTVSGTAVVTGEPEGPQTLAYTLEVVAGVGVLTGTLGSAPAESVTGVVWLSPGATPGNPAAGQCVSSVSFLASIMAFDGPVPADDEVVGEGPYVESETVSPELAVDVPAMGCQVTTEVHISTLWRLDVFDRKTKSHFLGDLGLRIDGTGNCEDTWGIETSGDPLPYSGLSSLSASLSNITSLDGSFSCSGMSGEGWRYHASAGFALGANCRIGTDPPRYMEFTGRLHGEFDLSNPTQRFGLTLAGGIDVSSRNLCPRSWASLQIYFCF